MTARGDPLEQRFEQPVCGVQLAVCCTFAVTDALAAFSVNVHTHDQRMWDGPLAENPEASQHEHVYRRQSGTKRSM